MLIAGDNTSKKKTRYLTQAFYFINDFVWHYNEKIKWTTTLQKLDDIFSLCNAKD
jgi:hypothetical protein